MMITFQFKVDGNWAAWSSWSGCDVTCANGIQTRTRQCTNPTPINGGLDCPGSTTESRPCSFPPCPGKYFIDFDRYL